MTVAELIERLQKFPGNAKVVTGGFDEWGFDDVEFVKPHPIAPIKQNGHGPRYISASAVDLDTQLDGAPETAVFIDWAEPTSKVS